MAPGLESAGCAARRRQADHEAGAALGPVGDVDAAAVAVDDPGGDGEAEAGARRPAHPAPGRTARTRAAGPPAGCPGRRPRPRATRRCVSARTATPTRPSAGLWRIALSTRIITSWRSRAGSPATTAGCGSTTTRTPRSVAGLPIAGRAVGGDVAEVDRHVLERDRPRVGAGEQQQVLDDRGHVADLVIDVLERRADRRDRLVAMPLEVLDAAPDDGQRRPQLVAGVGRELALAPERGALVGQRLADRHERPPRIDRPEPERDEDDDDRRRSAGPRASRRASAARRSGRRRSGRRTSRRPGACTFSVRMRTGVWTVVVDPPGRSPGPPAMSCGRRGRRSAPPPRRPCRAGRRGRRNPRWVSDVVVLVDGQRERAATAAAAEEEAVRPASSRRARAAGRSGSP